LRGQKIDKAAPRLYKRKSGAWNAQRGETEMEERIIRACIALFNRKGCKFTLDDVVAELKISRKTFYKYFSSKEEALKVLIDRMHGYIHEKQQLIYADPELSTREKLRRSLTLETKFEADINLEKIYQVEQYYPDVYRHFMEIYEMDWDDTEALLRRGMEEGVFRRENVGVVKGLLKNGMKMLYQGDFLSRNKITYHEALCQSVDIILRGIDSGGDETR
jgi:AcrR family transcriptional regulator